MPRLRLTGNTWQEQQRCSFLPRRKAARPPILRLSPEYDGIELLYANDSHPDTLFSLKILAWARLANGDTVAMVPWLKTPLPQWHWPTR